MHPYPRFRTGVFLPGALRLVHRALRCCNRRKSELRDPKHPVRYRIGRLQLLRVRHTAQGCAFSLPAALPEPLTLSGGLLRGL
jgi:hypothetical protein